MNFALSQTATYWGPATPDGYGGGTYPSPVAITCRWEDSTELVINRVGEEVMARAKIFAETDLVVGGFLFLGSSIAVDPRAVADAWEIIRIKKVPSLSADQFLRTIWVR
jgi:hypothetical protein